MGVRLHISAGHEGLLADLGLLNPERAPDFERGDVVFDSGSSRLRRFRWPPDSGPLFYIKVYRYYRLRPMFTYSLRPVRAWNEYRSLTYLRAHGMPVPEPVAFGSHRRTGIMRSCFLITRGIEGAVNLEQYLPEFFRRPHDDEWRNTKTRGLRDLAQLVRRMHAADFFDGDLFLRNILTIPQPGPGEPLRFWFLDHPRGRVIAASQARARQRALLHDLSCLDRHAARHFSRSERLRFFLEATGAAGLDSSARKMIQAIGFRRERGLEKRQRAKARRAGRGRRSSRPW